MRKLGDFFVGNFIPCHNVQTPIDNLIERQQHQFFRAVPTQVIAMRTVFFHKIQPLILMFAYVKQKFAYLLIELHVFCARLNPDRRTGPTHAKAWRVSCLATAPVAPNLKEGVHHIITWLKRRGYISDATHNELHNNESHLPGALPLYT